MTLIRGILFALLAPLALAGCFTSPEPLIGADQAVFPYQRIVFGEADRQDDRQTWTRKGDSYSFKPDDGDEKEALVRLLPVAENLYVVQMEFPEDDQTQRLFALLKVDLAAMTAESYSAIIPDDFQDVPGLSRCEDVVCIGGLDAYIAYARAGIAAGHPPDTTYRIISLE
jgi:hypothetical protein